MEKPNESTATARPDHKSQCYEAEAVWALTSVGLKLL